jgi:hypothetical protein
MTKISALKDVFERMKTAANVPDAKADGNKLRTFFREVAPGHDEEKVYASDMKKITNWFAILKDLPLFAEADPTTAPAETPVAVEEPTAVADNLAEKTTAKKKPAAKKSPAK